MELPISERTWAKLIELNEAAAWAEKGVFATAVGSRYVPNDYFMSGKALESWVRVLVLPTIRRLSEKTAENGWKIGVPITHVLLFGSSHKV